MNPALIIIVLILAILLWFLLSFSFKFIGGVANKLKENAKNAMFEEEEEENKRSIL